MTNEVNDNGGNQPANDSAGYQEPGQQATITPGPQHISPETTEALRERFRALKVAKLDGSATPDQLRESDQLRDYLYGGGPIPETYREVGKDPETPVDSFRDAVDDHFAPALSREDFKDFPAKLDGRITGEQQTAVQDLTLALGAPASFGAEFAERLAHHGDFQNGEGELQSLEDLDATPDEVFQAFAASYNSAEEAATAYAKARSYVEAVLDPKALAELDNGIANTTLGIDPWVINKLAALWDARTGGH